MFCSFELYILIDQNNSTYYHIQSNWRAKNRINIGILNIIYFYIHNS